MKKKGQGDNGTMRQGDEGKTGNMETRNQEKKESNHKGKNDNGGKAWKKPKRRENS